MRQQQHEHKMQQEVMAFQQKMELDTLGLLILTGTNFSVFSRLVFGRY